MTARFGGPRRAARLWDASVELPHTRVGRHRAFRESKFLALHHGVEELTVQDVAGAEVSSVSPAGQHVAFSPLSALPYHTAGFTSVRPVQPAKGHGAYVDTVYA